MRVFLTAATGAALAGGALAAAACSGTPQAPARAVEEPPPAPAPQPRRARPAAPSFAPRDPLDALSSPPVQVASILVGPGQLVPGGSVLEPADASVQLDVQLLEVRGNDVRIGVRHSGLAFAIWTQRAQLLGILASDQRVSASAGGDAQPAKVTLLNNARVEQLQRSGDWVEVRYIGTVDVEGWVPATAISDQGRAHYRSPNHYDHGRNVLFTRGSAIRATASSTARILAVLHYSATLSATGDASNGWWPVTYRNNEVRVTGFVSKTSPPSLVHERPAGDPAPAIATNAKLAPGTCLFVEHEPVGFVAEPVDGLLQPASRPGWFTLTVNTPWEETIFEVRGAVDTQLDPCPSDPP